jgi:2-dehydro-3-deoxygluconokinase
VTSNHRYYFPSHEEFCRLWDVKTIEEGLRLVNKQASGLVTVVKDGDNGAYYFESGQMRHVDAIKVAKVINVTGAGDSFNAGVMAAIVRGESLTGAIGYGCKIAAEKISQDLRVVVTPLL